MTILKTFSEDESQEDMKFGIKIDKFYLQYHYKGKVYEITTENLTEFYAIYLVGINGP